MIPYKDIQDKDMTTYNVEYGVSCIYNTKKGMYSSFEDETSIHNKIEYMKQQGLSGVISSEIDDVLSTYVLSAVPKEESNNNIIYITSSFTNIASY